VREADGITEYPPLLDHLVQMIEQGKPQQAKIPLFGSRGGRLKQACTQRWKISAVRQQLRRMGATSARYGLGLYYSLKEIARMKGANPEKHADGFTSWNDIDGTIRDKKTGTVKPKISKWTRRYYPLIHFQLSKTDCEQALLAAGIPWIVSSECDMCPHQDKARWLRLPEERLNQIIDVERKMNGEFFFTDARIPLDQRIQQWRNEQEQQGMDWEWDKEEHGCASDGFCLV